VKAQAELFWSSHSPRIVSEPDLKRFCSAIRAACFQLVTVEIVAVTVITPCGTERPTQTFNIRWTREFWEAMKPFLADAAYVNYLGEVEEEGIRAAYGKKYERLAALKAKYDPTNFFCMNQNIKPSCVVPAAIVA